MRNPVTVRRFEALSVFTLCLLIYYANGFSWGLFALLFFTPDLAMFGYAVSTSFGNRLYNTTHFFLFPVILFFLVYFFAQSSLLPYALIWASHISLPWSFALSLIILNSMTGNPSSVFVGSNQIP